MTDARRRWTESRVAELRRLWDAGHTYLEIAQHFGTSDTAIWAARRRNKLPPRAIGAPKGAKKRNQIVRPTMRPEQYRMTSR